MFSPQQNSTSDGFTQELAHVVPEPVESWQQVARTKKGLPPHNLLGEFYKDPERYAYTFQNYVFMTRFLQERNSSTNEKLLRVMERSVYSDRNVFVESVREQGWLSELEMDLYNAWLSPMINVSIYMTAECVLTSIIHRRYRI